MLDDSVRFADKARPAGVTRTLQVFYLALGLLILVLAVVQWAGERRAAA